MKSKGKDSPIEHGEWTNSVQFFITSLGLAVGVGNVWRFPSVVYQNGGAAFLVAYVICMVFIAMPLVLLETSIAQYSKKGPIEVWSMVPLLQGLGIAMVFTNILLTIYYSTAITWAAYYFVNSFSTDLPWKPHNNNVLDFDTGNYDSGLDAVAAENYFYNVTLKLSPAVDEWGGFRWELFGCNIVISLFMYCCVFLGPKSLGNISYFTSFFPYVMLTIMLVYTATLPGAYRGVQFYITHVDWKALLEVRLWHDAIGQALFSTSCTMGSLLNLASYNSFHHNVYRDAIFLPLADTFTSIFSGFSVFAVLGHIADRTNTTYVGDVVQSGPGLIFISYPEVFAALDGGYILSALFFLMIVLLGISSTTPAIDMYCSVISDGIPALNRTRARNLVFRFCFMVVLCVASAIFYSEMGYYWYYIIDARASAFPLVFIGITELITVAWIYNKPFRNNYLLRNIEEMVGVHWSARSWAFWNVFKYVWLVSWTLIAPATLSFIFIYDLAHLTPLAVNGYVLPAWAVNCSWTVNGTAVFCILAGMIIVPCWRFGGYSAWLQATKPLEAWKSAEQAEKPLAPVPQVDSTSLADETSSFL